MEFVNVFFAFLATKRLVWIIKESAVFGLGRRVLGVFGPTRALLGCQLCISVWCGALATAVFVWFPFANWPFALSYAFEFWGMLEYAVNFFLDKDSAKVILYPVMGGTRIKLENLKQEVAEAMVVSLANQWRDKKNGM